MFNHTAEYHVLALALQADINEAVVEVITTVSNILRDSTRETLTSFDEHFQKVEQIYKPFYNDFLRINDAHCRKQAQDFIIKEIEFSENYATLCASDYNSHTTPLVQAANKEIGTLDDRFGQVQLIVTRNFIRQNAFVAPEDIKIQITNVFEDVKAKWLAAKPELDGIRTKLSSDIKAQNVKLDECHENIQEEVSALEPIVRRSVQVCIDRENVVSPFSVAKNVEDIDEEMSRLFEELKVAISKVKYYEW